MFMDNCIFCKIVKGDIKAEKVYEDDHAVAFLDVHPIAPGHTLVIPKHHAPMLTAVEDDEIGPFFLVAKKVAGMLTAALTPDGFTMGINQGSVSGQSVDHLHFHLIPRWHGDNGKSIHSVVSNEPKERIEVIAEKIRNTK
jgi:histidine triad (HIT) family protein